MHIADKPGEEAACVCTVHKCLLTVEFGIDNRGKEWYSRFRNFPSGNNEKGENNYEENVCVAAGSADGSVHGSL